MVTPLSLGPTIGSVRSSAPSIFGPAIFRPSISEAVHEPAALEDRWEEARYCARGASSSSTRCTSRVSTSMRRDASRKPGAPAVRRQAPRGTIAS